MPPLLKERLRVLAKRLQAWAKRHPRRALATGGAVLAALVLLFTIWPTGDTTQFVYHEVKRGDFLVSIIEGGTLKAVNEVTVRSEMEGVARIISIMPEGTNVQKGDLLVELDSSDLRDRVSAQDVTFQSVQFAFVQAKENLEIQKSLIESNIKDAELRVEFGRSDLEKYREGDWPQLRKVTEAKITIAAEELERTRNKNDWTKKLFEKGYATKSELEADALSVKRKEIELGQVQEELRLLTKYDYPKKVRQLEANLESYQKELERVKLRAEANIAQLEASLKTQRNTLDLQEKRLKDLKAQLELTKIYAPQDGLVVYASSSSPGSGTLIEEGATVRQKQDIIKLPDVSKMMIEVRVHESHVQKIRPGLNAVVTIDSLPGQEFRGSVHKVGVLPDSSSRFYNPNLKVYVTEVHLEEPLTDLKPGISGRAEIIITNLQNVLTVPIQAVTTVKGRQVCMLEAGSKAKTVPVEVGLYNDKLIEIKAGLREHDMVALAALDESNRIDLPDSMASTKNSASNRGAFKPGPVAATAPRNSAAVPVKTDKAKPAKAADPKKEREGNVATLPPGASNPASRP